MRRSEDGRGNCASANGLHAKCFPFRFIQSLRRSRWNGLRRRLGTRRRRIEGFRSWDLSRTGFSLSGFEFFREWRKSKEDRLKPVLLNRGQQIGDGNYNLRRLTPWRRRRGGIGGTLRRETGEGLA